MKYCLFIALILFYSPIHGQNNISPGNCETNSARLDYLRTKAVEAHTISNENVIIAVARLGGGERNVWLNRRRLYALKKYLGSSVTNLIVAQGERVNDNGRIEIYLYGMLAETLSVKKGKDLPVGNCDNELLDFKNYQLSVTSRNRK